MNWFQLLHLLNFEYLMMVFRMTYNFIFILPLVSSVQVRTVPSPLSIYFYSCSNLPFQYACIHLFLEFTLSSKSMHTWTFKNTVTTYDMQLHTHELNILVLKHLVTIWSCPAAGKWCGITVQIWNILLHCRAREGCQGVLGTTAEAVEQEDCYWDSSCQEVLQSRGVPPTVPRERGSVWF